MYECQERSSHSIWEIATHLVCEGGVKTHRIHCRIHNPVTLFKHLLTKDIYNNTDVNSMKLTIRLAPGVRMRPLK